ncbi:MFS transporter [Vandammella animalimorsus]|uniref:MFS transporter n=1 Tax=Vandammella animalimorsus TaxID=2029117 RepID=A0A2A2T3B3_9BURK|nr:YbfB/YjiJ family MFS transporter [Vandammella animalimorsus]PAT32650.1 MFS transporter [Vandammella animalimorsus]PAX15975.1 MFS transporter [Vandammella animalimorsus]PAX18111.1 MFS transporter [Vandammella animalimorsus]
MSEHTTTRPCALAVALAGLLALAIAMGLGRFAFTPMLPLMVRDGLLDLRQGSWLATLNYLGYLLGALACMALPWLLRQPQRLRAWGPWLLLAGLAATAVLLLLMALPLAWLWPGVRLLAGVASAVAFVHTSGWCLEQLAMRRAGQLGGIVYSGPGIGILASGLMAWALQARPALLTWAVQALAAVVMAAWVLRVVWRSGALQRAAADAAAAPAAAPAPSTAPAAPATASAQPAAWAAQPLLLALAYGLAGFGYIITATYLPVIAQGVIPGSRWIAWFWPIFGACVALGAASTGLIPARVDRRWLLLLCHLLQACGVVLPLLLPNATGFVLGSALLGLPFTAITLFGMQEARRLRPTQATAFMGSLTALYGLGQIAGPPLVVQLLHGAASQQQGFALALWVAAAGLLAGALLYGLMLALERRSLHARR